MGSQKPPCRIEDAAGQVSARAIGSWLTKWGGKYGTQGSGRDGYCRTLDILTAQKTPPNENQLKAIMATLARSMPS